MLDLIKKEIREYKLIEKEDLIIVGVSGGADSVCLLHILLQLQEEYSLRLVVAHINHLMRGVESDEDESFVRNLCKDWKIPFYCERIDIKHLAAKDGIGLEEAGRNVRYQTFHQLREKISGNKIAVAHNLNDQAETILMRILRGTGPSGIRAMEKIRGDIIRPLLCVPRAEIERYIKLNHLSMRTDSSNFESNYTRNKIRIKLIPSIQTEFGLDPVPALTRFSTLIGEDCDYLDRVAERIYSEVTWEKQKPEQRKIIYILLEKVKPLHPAILKRIVRKAIAGIKGNMLGIHHYHITAIIALINEGKTGSRIDIANGLVAEKSYDSLAIMKYEPYFSVIQESLLMKIPGVTQIEPLGIVVKATLLDLKELAGDKKSMESGLIQYFDYEKTGNQISIRSRLAGDLIKPYGAVGTKKLKKYFIDEKIPREKRDQFLIVAIEASVIWIVGVRTSNDYRITEHSSIVLQLEIQNTAANQHHSEEQRGEN